MSDEDPRQRLAYDRTHLANERTFASWIRTGLSVAAIGVAIVHLTPTPKTSELTQFLIEATFVLAGAAMILFGAYRFARVYRDLTAAGSPRVLVGARAIYVLSILLVVLLLLILLLF